MDISDLTFGKTVLLCCVSAFTLIVIWINTYPFIDEESPIYSNIPDPQWFLLFCAIWGMFFIGGLMTFTLYHLYPHL